MVCVSQVVLGVWVHITLENVNAGAFWAPILVRTCLHLLAHQLNFCVCVPGCFWILKTCIKNAILHVQYVRAKICFKRIYFSKYHQLGGRRALSLLNNIQLRTRKVLLLYKVNGNNALLVLNGTSLNSYNALLGLDWINWALWGYDITNSLIWIFMWCFVIYMFHKILVKLKTFIIPLFFVWFSSSFHCCVCISVFFS